MMRKKIRYRDLDKTLLIMPVVIFLIGLLSIYSASFKGANVSAGFMTNPLAVRQMLWMGAALLLILLMSRINYFQFQDYVWPFYFFCVLALVAVFLFPSRMGAHRWIGFGGSFGFQPSELSKLAIIGVLANFFSTNKLEYMSKRKWIQLFFMIGIPFALILKEPDLGTGLTLLPVFAAMLYLWGIRARYIFAVAGLGAIASPVLYHFMKEYQKTRVLVFLNPSMDPLGAGYNIIQSKIGIGSGGFLGKGFMSGTQNRLNFIPERHTDFIFAVVGEEGGFIASALILVLFWLIVRRGYQISSQTPDRFGSQLACGIATMIGIQAAINLGMTMGLLPVVGMPLPLVSYGGTSLLITMLAIGILVNIRLHKPLF